MGASMASRGWRSIWRSRRLWGSTVEEGRGLSRAGSCAIETDGGYRSTDHVSSGAHRRPPGFSSCRATAAVAADNLRLFRMLATNLFPSDAEPIETHAGLTCYPLRPLSRQTAAATEVWSVGRDRQITALGTSILPPFELSQHATGAVPGLYWILLRDEAPRAPKRAVGPATRGRGEPA
ncbi:type VI secretion system baseplate subunit TssF [Burkholderia multivorans]|uniref:type VI secretion system baseplate subunit TssF n=2 Tax=Burkholderia multivorans TaxID=87883 RepID=UPI00286FB50B|nr:type VI secretion system baseplate subunit TssF [Burkholderia multivorans]